MAAIASDSEASHGRTHLELEEPRPGRELLRRLSFMHAISPTKIPDPAKTAELQPGGERRRRSTVVE